MPVRVRALSLIFSFVAALLVVAAPPPTPALAGGGKVAIIVGPVGGLTGTYRSMADRVASAATAAGATVTKAYSPAATWQNVRAAVDGASVVVYFGHGSGYPNPYSATEWVDRVNGWGLNRTTTNGDSDNWSTTMVYCGEKALLGTLASTDGVHQWNYCGGSTNTDGITPAAGFTMIYAQAHYAPGFGERYQPSDPIPSQSEAQQRVRNYSYPVLALGASGYIATAYGDAPEIVTRVLTGSNRAFGEIFREGKGYSAKDLVTMAHPDIAGAEVWVQKTVAGSLHFGDPDYWYAFAGRPAATPAGGTGSFATAPFTDIGASPFYDDIVWIAEQGITNGCADRKFCPGALVTRDQMASFLARALQLPAATRDYFVDDAGSTHEADINRVAAAGITNGCGDQKYCPTAEVTRDQMASFLARSLQLPPTATDYFSDDAGNDHEDAINRIAAAGVTNGCGGGRYCPGAGVTREQMAAFLHRAFGG